MPPCHSPYISDPATPTLAHSLLPQPPKPPSESQSQSQQETNQPSTWNLKHDVNQGFQDSGSPTSLFRYGTVIGFSRLRNSPNDDDNANSEDVAELPRTLITSNLSQHPPTAFHPPRVYIIHPANYDGFSPTTLLSSLLSTRHRHQENLSRNEAIRHLDAVQLLPVFDLPAAVQAIDQVTDALQQLLLQKTTISPDMGAGAGAGAGGRGIEPTNPVLFIVAGLDVLTDGIVRASNTTRGTALLTTILWTLTRLSRQHAAYLSVMLVGIGGVGSVSVSSSAAAASASGQTRAESGGDGGDDEGVYSVFCRARDEGPLFPSLLMRTMDNGVDCHLLLSTVKGTQVVEVIKDRVGDNLGRWAVWRAGKQNS